MVNLVDILNHASPSAGADLSRVDTGICESLFELSQLIDHYFEEQSERRRIQFYSYGFDEFVAGLNEGYNKHSMSFDRTPFYYKGHDTGQKLRDRLATMNGAIAGSYQRLPGIWKEVIATLREELKSLEFANQDPYNFLLDQIRDGQNRTALDLKILLGEYPDFVNGILHGKSQELEQNAASFPPVERHVKLGLIYLLDGKIGPAQANFKMAYSRFKQKQKLASALKGVYANVNEAYRILKPLYDGIEFARQFDGKGQQSTKI